MCAMDVVLILCLDSVTQNHSRARWLSKCIVRYIL